MENSIEQYEHSGAEGLSRSASSSSLCTTAVNVRATATTNAQGLRLSWQGRKKLEQETTAVNRSKKLVFGVVFLAAATVGTITYVMLNKDETDTFESEFKSLAAEIINTAETNARTTREVMSSLAVTLTSHIASSNVSFPFVSLPHFEYRCAEARRLAKSEFIALDVLVDNHTRTVWEHYALENQGWIREGLDYRGESSVKPGFISRTVRDAGAQPDQLVVDDETRSDPNVQSVLWQMSPAPTDASVVLQDLNQVKWYKDLSAASLEAGRSILSGIVDVDFLTHASSITTTTKTTLAVAAQTREEIRRPPQSVLVIPYYDAFASDARPGGHLLAVVSWTSHLDNLLPAGSNGYVVVVNDGCGTLFTFRINGPDAIFVGYGDRHDRHYNRLAMHSSITGVGYPGRDAHPSTGIAKDGPTQLQQQCQYTMSVYPSSELEGKYQSNDPALFASVVILVFILTAIFLLLYDAAVQRRQDRVVSTAKRTSILVSSLFPENIQQRILDQVEKQDQEDEATKDYPKKHPTHLLDNNEGRSNKSHLAFKSKPIADLFPETTIMFADMVGFTAWSSAREPASVFTLLETIFHAFDETARRRGVFKVETVGDCYVAVAGLPEPRDDHAVVMARFAQDCRRDMNRLTKVLEETLGPDTADLSLRIGLHSGPVTAGVLRGERARFQLFGDTMNTASRLESTGEGDRIQVSQDTANLLITAGKGGWLRSRSTKVVAKGKGELTTFWLEIAGDTGTMPKSSRRLISPDGDGYPNGASSQRKVVASRDTTGNYDHAYKLSDRYMRLINWNTEVLSNLLKRIVFCRQESNIKPDPLEKVQLLEKAEANLLILDEVVEVVTLPQYHVETMESDEIELELDQIVSDQLRDYVQTISMLYKESNPFHNFEHVSHVTMSVIKLLGRIVAPTALEQHITTDTITTTPTPKTLHDHTYGITSDPLTQFAVVFSALIHDVDHQGVPNAQLVKERATVAMAYGNKSVAEQNSVAVAWSLLMDPRFEALRRAIYVTVEEFKRFRQLVVNAVMATDIIDKDLGAARRMRWNKAFGGGDDKNDITTVNRKATIVIEHMIQASDVAHTMQHWHIYRKWNTRLFQEMYKAYKTGRSERDPSEFWFEGELGFFDHYIIPLARKLKDCGVFGVSSDEYLTYAMQNRREWEEKGRDVVAELVEGAKKLHNRFGPEQGCRMRRLLSSTSMRKLVS